MIQQKERKPRVKVNKQGQIIIPRRLLEKHGYQPWDWMEICLGRKHITLKRITEDGEDYDHTKRDWDEFFGRILSRRRP